MKWPQEAQAQEKLLLCFLSLLWPFLSGGLRSLFSERSLGERPYLLSGQNRRKDQYTDKHGEETHVFDRGANQAKYAHTQRDVDRAQQFQQRWGKWKLPTSL
jgi:hypothetical protein